jgi:hypothetical protein
MWGLLIEINCKQTVHLVGPTILISPKHYKLSIYVASYTRRQALVNVSHTVETANTLQYMMSTPTVIQLSPATVLFT